MSSALVVADELIYVRALDALSEALDVALASVLIAMMPVSLPAVAMFAPLCDFATHDLHDDMLEGADRAARAAALCLPATTAAMYQTLRCWSKVAELISGGHHDVVVLGRVPARRPLRRLIEVSRAARSALLFARADAACR